MRSNSQDKIGSVMVVGGGIGGIQASLDLADAGFKVYLVDEKPSIGGVMASLDKTFPTNDCSMCILGPKLVGTGRHPNIDILSYSDVKEVSGSAGNFNVKVLRKSRFIDETVCNGCGACIEVCPVEVPNEFDGNLSNRKAVYKLFSQAVPNVATIDKRGIPLCKNTCPIHMDVQGYVALIAQGKFKEALKVIRRSNPLPSICGRVCFHPCESKCKRGEVDQPIAIASLKRFVMDHEAGAEDEISPPPPKNKKVAVVGSGPAGLAAAHDLAQMGYKVVIFEALPIAGGMLAVGIPEYRLPKRILKSEIEYIQKWGVEIRTNTPVGVGDGNLSLDDLKRDGFEAIFLAVGAHKSMKLGVKGEELKGVIHGIDFLREVALSRNAKVGKRVAIVGGGNTAIDAARTALRLGCEEVHIVYRRSRAEMPAHEIEIEEAEKEGVKIAYLAAPVEILGKDGAASAMKCIRMELGEPDESGRRRPVPIPGSEFIIEVDTIIPAISQSPDLSFLGSDSDFRVTKWNTFEVNPKTLETNIPGIFAGGDAVSGPATIIDAIAAGKRAALAIDRYLRGESMEGFDALELSGIVLEDLGEREEGIERRERTPMPTLPVERRIRGFDEVELGFTEEMAIAEAKRCLNCGVCSECRECERVCELHCIHHDMPNSEVELSVGAIILAPGYDVFDATKLTQYGYGRFPNVVTSIEFERILSASGPYRGHVQRPSDGKTPRRIAFIQCVGSRDASCGNDYCSSVCCMYATKEAIIAKEHARTIEPTIFFIDMRAFGKGFDRYYERAQEEYGVRFVRSKISAVEEVPGSRSLKLRYESEDGKLTSEEFDMVILSVGLDELKEARKLSEIFGVELNEYGFCKTDDLSPMRTSREGIYVCGVFAGPKDIPETVMQASGAASEAAKLLAPARNTRVTTKEYPPERSIAGEPPRIGVFICHCGINIGGVVDVPEVVKYARTLDNVVYAEENLYTCSEDTQKLIAEKIKEYALNRVIVASCTPRTHEPLFRETVREAGLNPYLFEMANIRDQCSWVHMFDPQSATEKSKDLVRMAVAKVRLLTPLQKIKLPVKRQALVIGGGLSGMVASLDLAEQGFGVYLVEQERELGGNMRKIHYTLDGRDTRPFLESLIRRVTTDPMIKVFTEVRIESIDGYVGNFKTRLLPQNGGEPIELLHGVVIVATGAQEHTTAKYLYGKNPKVITQRELEARLADGGVDAKHVVMIQCVDSRNDERPYCSRVCCGEAIKNALKIKEQNPEANVYILYRDVRSYGFKEEYFQRARESGVLFMRYEDGEEPQVQGRDGFIKVIVDNKILKRRLQINADLLVLSVPMVAPESNKSLAQMLKVPLNEDNFFLEAHLKLRPVEFATDGVFVCGLAHSPKTIEESIAQASAAAAKAATILTKDTIETEGTVARVNEARCVACRMCEQVCPYKAVAVDPERNVAVVNEALCKGCGSCSASCRSGAIDLQGFEDAQILEEIYAL
ncbi:MAG: FAD-dependent oxidoreductase [bacterium]